MRESRDQQYTSSQTLERLLNEAIIHADISNSFEEHIEIFDTVYADDIEMTSDATQEPVRGKSRVRSLLFNSLVPLHEPICRGPTGSRLPSIDVAARFRRDHSHLFNPAHTSVI